MFMFSAVCTLAGAQTVFLIRDIWTYFREATSVSNNSPRNKRTIRPEAVIAQAFTVARSLVYFYDEYKLIYQQFDPKFSYAMVLEMLEAMRIGHAGIFMLIDKYNMLIIFKKNMPLKRIAVASIILHFVSLYFY